MSVFEYTMTLYSIVVALGLARILSGYVALIEHRKQFQHAPLFFIWLSFLLVIHVVWWFSMWDRSDNERFSLVEVVFMFHVPAFLFIATRLLIPGESELANMEQRFTKLRVPFLLCLAVVYVVAPSIFGVFFGEQTMASYLLSIGALLIVGTFSADLRLQYFVVVSAFLGYLGFALQFRSVLAG